VTACKIVCKDGERRDTMCWLKKIFLNTSDVPPPPEGMNADEEKQWRISLLTEDEYKAFKWFRLGYTARWTAETMLLDRKTARSLFDSVYRKLCVVDAAEVSRVYRTTKLTPQELPPEEDGL
jgi:DNA-binding CsgD family transcriptional regulator